MTDDLDILLSKFTTTEKKTISAKNLIDSYDLPLEIYEILEAFDAARFVINYTQPLSKLPNSFFGKYKFLFHKLLSVNVNMFVAIIKSRHDELAGKYACKFLISGYTSQGLPFKSYIITAYKTLLDYNDFDIDFDFNNSFVPEECKTAILEYKNNKYGGKLTKVAMN